MRHEATLILSTRSVLTVPRRQTNINKGELALKHAVGLGHQPNVVPITKAVFNGPSRPVEVGWHPVGGVAGKWFAEETGLGKMITERINKYPDPTQHWAVLVGDYAHQLWMVSLGSRMRRGSVHPADNGTGPRTRDLMSSTPTRRSTAKSGALSRSVKRASTITPFARLVSGPFFPSSSHILATISTTQNKQSLI